VIRALTLLLTCQLAGEVLVRAAEVPLPGPVLGMLFLFLLLFFRKASWQELDITGDTLLRNLSLLFVPAAVGVVQHTATLGAYWVALSAALIVSTALTLIVTAVVFRIVARMTGTGNGEPDMPADTGSGI
jgi:putative effector of murein hydrolase LrgA (UPF0299 family)